METARIRIAGSVLGLMIVTSGPLWALDEPGADAVSRQAYQQTAAHYRSLQEKFVAELKRSGADEAAAHSHIKQRFQEHAAEVLARQPEALVEQLGSEDLSELYIALRAWQIARNAGTDPISDPKQAVATAGASLWRFKEAYDEELSRRSWHHVREEPVFKMSSEILERHPEQTAQWLNENWADDPYAVAIAGDLGTQGYAFVERMIPLVGSEDPLVQWLAIQSVDDLLDAQKNFIVGWGKTLGEIPVQPDPRYLSYARHIVSRNDANDDGVLSPEEWNTMLSDPSPADMNRDKRITTEEYAAYMQLKAKR